MTDKVFNIYGTSITQFIFINYVDKFFVPKWKCGAAIFNRDNTLLLKYEFVLDEKHLFIFNRKRRCSIEFLFTGLGRNIIIDYYEKTGKHGTKITNIALNEKLQIDHDIHNWPPLNLRSFTIQWLFSKRGKEILTQLSEVVDGI